MSATGTGRNVMNGSKIVAMMETAFVAGTKVPSIVFETDEGRVKFYRQTERSKNPGAISLNDGGPMGADVWYGSINRDGSIRLTKVCPDWVLGLTSEFAKDPGAYAATYGKGSSRCCFCTTEITTAESLAVGYGPVCAGNYGLPWGSTTPTPAHEVIDAIVSDPSDPRVEDDFDSSFGGIEDGNSAEAALAAMEGAASYDPPEVEATAQSFDPTPTVILVDAILEAEDREAAIQITRMILSTLGKV